MRLKTKIAILLLSVFLAALVFNWIAGFGYADNIKLAECSGNEILTSCIAKTQTESPESLIPQKKIEQIIPGNW